MEFVTSVEDLTDKERRRLQRWNVKSHQNCNYVFSRLQGKLVGYCYYQSSSPQRIEIQEFFAVRKTRILLRALVELWREQRKFQPELHVFITVQLSEFALLNKLLEERFKIASHLPCFYNLCRDIGFGKQYAAAQIPLFLSDDQRPLSLTHIAGAPGSGKSTLMRAIQKQFGVQVYTEDADSWIQYNEDSGRKLLAITDPIDYERQWRLLKSENVIRAIQQNLTKHIVIIGLLDHFSFPEKSYWFEMPSITNKLYLSPPTEVILQQYYSRAATTPGFMEAVIQRHVVIDSSQQKLAQIPELEQLHIHHGYQCFASKGAILSHLAHTIRAQ